MNISDIMLDDKVKIAGIEVIDFPDFFELIMRFALNFSIIYVIVKCLYYSTTRRKDYFFTYVLISSVIFLLCFLLESVKLQIGFALGLFAIFGIIRYRTDSMPIREMTYLFLVIGISVINALANDKTSLADLFFTNAILVFLTWLLEKIWLTNRETSKTILYERIDLIKPGRYDELIKDLQERTGIMKINRVETGKIDFLKDTCSLTIYYENSGSIGSSQLHDNNSYDDEE
jgi:hypothetical protein